MSSRSRAGRPQQAVQRAESRSSGPVSSTQERASAPESVARSTSSTARRRGTPMGKRQSRAARRAELRRRRTNIATGIAAVLVIAAIAWLLRGEIASIGQSSAASKQKASACAPTPTAVVAPMPAATPDPTPPPVKGKTVAGPSGLQYVDITVGCGATAKSGDTVTVTYTGWVQSTGKMFDSSLLHGGTFKIPSPLDSPATQAQVIQGWNIGLDGMKVGGTRRLIIPPSLGYGSTPMGTIPPNSTLIFDITLVSIQ